MKIVNEQEYQNTIKEGYTLVDFFATWCGPCRALAPVLEQLEQLYPNVKFIKVDVDQQENLAASLNIMSIPTIYLFKDGRVVAKSGGYRELDSMKSFLDDNLNN